MAVQEYEREAKLKVKNEVTKFLRKIGYHVPDTEIGTLAMAQQRPTST